MRAIAISLALHGVAAVVLATCSRAHARQPPGVQLSIARADPAPIEVAMISDAPATPQPASPHRGGGGTPSRLARVPSSHSAWDDVAISRDADSGDLGTDGGTGGGRGHGIGLGDGGGIAAAPQVPAPPPPVISRARPARLLVPMRQADVDGDELFIARVTIDEDGDVVGAHMVRTHPGGRGELAESAIWTFHYDPARDDSGNAVRSTFEQPFAIR